MKNARKILSCFLVLVFVIILLGAGVSGEDTNIIYQTSTKQTITQGVTSENIVRFTTNGWLNINVMTVDLSNKYIKVNTITNPDSAGMLASTRTLAEKAGAVAAVNANFFTPAGGGSGYPIGPIIQAGEFVSVSSEHNEYNDSLATFSLTKLNEALLAYWQTDISLTAPNGIVIPVARYNKIDEPQFTDLTIMDRKLRPTSIGASAILPDIVEMVVDGGVVTQILISQPAVAIPENGYVAVTRTAGGKQLTDNFKVGDKVEMNIVTNPDWENINMSVTGGSILVRDGKIPENFSYDIPYIAKNQPRTVIGSTKDGKKLLLVTVDGRQGSSIGMTQTEIAQFMLGIGANNALNLDGGGSTTMVGRELGATSPEVMNSPSDGFARGVSNAIGVFSIAPHSALSGLVIDTEDGNIFVNTTRVFTVRGYDKYFNPVEVKPENVKWSVTGVKGAFNGNVFKPSTFGEGRIFAKAGAVSVSYPISVLSAPVKLVLSDNIVKLPINQTKTFTVKGINKNGYSAIINPGDVKWTVNGNIGAFTGTTFTAKTKGTGYIDASMGNTHAYSAVSVSQAATSIRDNFEAANGSFAAYPDTVKGSYEISTEQKYAGKSSGKLTYDFTATEDTRAAYMVLPDKGLTLEAGVSRLGLYVYNDHGNSNWLRAEIIDAKGQKQLVDIVRNLDWTGWKKVETTLENIEMPAKLTRLYLVQINPVAESGAVYFDDLSITNSGYPAIDPTKIPKDTIPVDEAYKVEKFTKATSDSFRFGLLGQSREPANALEKQLIWIYADKINKYVDVSVVLGTGSHEAVSKLIKKKPVVAVNTVDLKSTKKVDYEYSFTDIKNSRFFKMDMRNKGLRLSDSSQWQQFQKDLDSFKGSNAFILLENSPDKFSDKLEMKLFKETLTKYKQKTGKNVWVFFKGDKNESYMERGIRYISAAGYEVPGLAPGKTGPAVYVMVTVKGKAITYNFRQIDS
ncbi:MAG: phosphodiester glycosidase family protein [Ruminiclostridium sp.]|nr:phosphodiester glycosidase family protein [Ruminiclostridium sp.]